MTNSEMMDTKEESSLIVHLALQWSKKNTVSDLAVSNTNKILKKGFLNCRLIVYRSHIIILLSS